MPTTIRCRNCGRKVCELYISRQHLGEASEMLDYCSEYCYTAIESPEDLKYMDKPSWINTKGKRTII